MVLSGYALILATSTSFWFDVFILFLMLIKYSPVSMATSSLQRLIKLLVFGIFDWMQPVRSFVCLQCHGVVTNFYGYCLVFLRLRNCSTGSWLIWFMICLASFITLMTFWSWLVGVQSMTVRWKLFFNDSLPGKLGSVNSRVRHARDTYNPTRAGHAWRTRSSGSCLCFPVRERTNVRYPYGARVNAR